MQYLCVKNTIFFYICNNATDIYGFKGALVWMIF